ncbi:Extracellular serine protease [Mixta theicola]|nr:autotransporter serine protease [Mixta theicola]QHM76854.1 Extracellular serine protease [Mixta theicola]
MLKKSRRLAVAQRILRSEIKGRQVRYSALAAAVYLGAVGPAIAGNYIEQGVAGDAASWRSSEFNAEWGLGAIHADEAYAAGYSGKGIRLGIFDQPVYAQHPEFVGANKVINLVTEGVRAYTDPYIPVKAGDAFKYDGTPSLDSGGELGTHGTHVGGIAAGSRDGGEMHGVAWGAQIVSAENGDPGPEDGIVLGNDGAVYKAGWDALRESGVRIINNSWGIGITDKFSQGGRDPAYPNFTVNDAQKQFDQIKQILGTVPGGAYQGAIDAARSGIVTIFAAGNDYNLNNPDAMGGLAYFVPDIAPNWLTVASLQQEEEGYTISTFSSRCGYTASFCVSAPGSRVYSSVIEGASADDLTTGYAKYSGTSMAAPHVAGSIAVLMERFPYMTGAQVAQVLKTTTVDMGDAGIDALYGWGMIDLGKAIHGPGMFYTVEDIPEAFRVPDPDGSAYGSTQFVANIPGIGAMVDADQRYAHRCEGVQCAFDIWSNDISGHGGLTKEGAGALLLTGNNTYSGPTLVNNGLLAINGSLTSAVRVQQQGALGGSGRVGALTVARGGTVAPGNSIGTLNVDGDVNFEAGSRYAVEVAPDGRSDRIASGGAIHINGGEVAVSLENGDNLLSRSEVQSLAGRQYTILSATNGISGQFASSLPSYAFLGTSLGYQGNQVSLAVGRNDVSFTSVAATDNQRAVAAAANALGAGNPLYESLLLSGSVGEARQAFRQLSGQVHADIASAQVNDSRYLRDTLNDRLRQAEGLAAAGDIKADEGGAWAKMLGAWDHASGDASATGYQASTWGVLLGLDSAWADDWRMGVATGYTRTSLDGGYGADADSDNYHLAVYGGKEYGALALRAGAGYTWHRFDTARSIRYGSQSDRASAQYNARTEQFFAEAGYAIPVGAVNLEPFANLSYVNFQNNRIAEQGGAAALHGDKQHTDATLSTLGLRSDFQWDINLTTSVALRGELGWQHQYGDLDRGMGLKFNGSNTPFVVNSVVASRDGAVIKASAEMALNADSRLSLGYSGLISDNYQDNSVNAGFSWNF